MPRKPDIIDERTGRPCDYSKLYAEAGRLAKSDGIKLGAAFGRIADAANSVQRDSITRALRRWRTDHQAPVPASVSDSGGQPIPGYGVLWSNLSDYLRRIEDEVEQSINAQKMSAHRLRIAGDKIRALLEIAEVRLAFLESVGRERGAQLLRPHLGNLWQIDGSQDPEAFYDAELRQVQLILTVGSRVLHHVTSTLDWLK